MRKITTVTHLIVVIQVIKYENLPAHALTLTLLLQPRALTSSSSPSNVSRRPPPPYFFFCDTMLHSTLHCSTPSRPHFFFSTMRRHHCKPSPFALAVGRCSHRVLSIEPSRCRSSTSPTYPFRAQGSLPCLSSSPPQLTLLQPSSIRANSCLRRQPFTPITPLDPGNTFHRLGCTRNSTIEG